MSAVLLAWPARGEAGVQTTLWSDHTLRSAAIWERTRRRARFDAPLDDMLLRACPAVSCTLRRTYDITVVLQVYTFVFDILSRIELN